MSSADLENSRTFLVQRTYKVTIVMLIVGQIQVTGAMNIKPLKDFLEDRHSVSLALFIISFVSIQMYGFFYHVIEAKPFWVRMLAGLWTYEVNTMSIMKPARKAPYVSFLIAIFLTYLMMLVSCLYANLAAKRSKGFFTSRHNVILWSERIFVVTCFGIIVGSEMKRISVEFVTLLTYTIISNVFVVIFAASIQRPYFYHSTGGDFILIGQLFYLNFYALFMSFVWTISCFVELIDWKGNKWYLIK